MARLVLTCNPLVCYTSDFVYLLFIFPGDSPGNKVMAEGKKCFVVQLEGYLFSQLIATAITFSCVYGSRHPDKGSFIPAIQTYPSGFTVAFYDYKTDCLLIRSFTWSSVSLVYLWCVLHYRLLGISTCDKTRSGYLELSKANGGDLANSKRKSYCLGYRKHLLELSAQAMMIKV